MLNCRRILALALLWIGCPCQPVAAATNSPLPASSFIVDHWGTEDGLPQSSVITMTQTRDGFLWLGTLNGLARFDGIHFTVFDENNTPGLASSRIVFLFEDRAENFWLGTETAGIFLVRPGGRVVSLDIGRGGREKRLMAACEDASGAVWLYTADCQLSRYRDGQVDVWNVGTERDVTLAQVENHICRAVVPAETNLLWVGSDHRLGAFETGNILSNATLPAAARDVPSGKLDGLLARADGGQWRLVDGRIEKWGTNALVSAWSPYPWTNAVTSACEDREGNLVVGTDGAGVFWFDASGRATCISTNEGLSHNYVLSVLADREGNLWVGTDSGGLNRVKRNPFEVVNGTDRLVVLSVAEDERGGLWVGSNDRGVGHWQEGQLQPLLGGQGPLTGKAVFVDRSRRVWMSILGAGLFVMENGVLRRAPGPAEVQRYVFAIYQDRAGRLWFGTDNGLIAWDEREWTPYKMRQGLSSDYVTAIAETASGDLWIGTQDAGLNLLKDGRFVQFRKAAQELPGDKVTSLWVDADNVLWAGTSGGLARFANDRWTHYGTREGLISSSIHYVIEDAEGNLWLGSNAGLMRASKSSLNAFANGVTNKIECRTYGKADGLPTGECAPTSQPGACRGREGRMYFPTIRGLVTVNTARLKPSSFQPPAVIESVSIGGDAQGACGLGAPAPRALTIPPGREQLEIHYTGLNLAAPERTTFKYRLEGHDAAWTYAGRNRVARYTKLPPGDYQFRVMAANEDGVWNTKGAGLSLIQQPPFWQTWWFLGACTAVLLGLIVGSVHVISTQTLQRKLRQQQALERDRSRIARDLHDQLGASLTQVSLLGEMAESDKHLPDEVEAHAKQITQTARETTRMLDEIVWAVNPANDSLEGLASYICQHAQDYLAVAGVRYRWEVSAQLPAVALPPEVRHNVFLAAKESVTNIVRHAKATSVAIRLKLDADTFTLEIEDDGLGLANPEKAATRNGLNNMRKRMEDVGGRFAIEPAAPRGTVVRLTAPIVKRK